MKDTQAKYHHLIPQTYMSAWANTSGTIKIKFLKNPTIVEKRNKENIAGITDYHSIKAGMPICTKQDADLIFAAVLPFTVELDGEILSDSLALNNKYYDFDRWIITRSDGSPVSKKKLKHEIEQVKIKDIEANWSTKYENNWSIEVSKIESVIQPNKNTTTQAFDKDYLMKFFTALDWRGFNSNKQFEDVYQSLTKAVLESINIPENERVFPFLKTASEEMRHYLLLKYYRDYLNDTGVIYTDASENLKHTSFHFLVADGPTRFITSDTPAFLHKREDGQLVGLLPITPNILMAKGWCSDGENKYYVSHITDEAVQNYNATIYANADEFVIIPNNDIAEE